MKSRLLALALLLSILGTLEAASMRLGRRYKDETNGFQIQPPVKWEQVPTKFQEVSIVGKWSSDRGRGRYSRQLFVLRFLKGKVEDAKNPQDALKRGIPGYGSMLRLQPKDIWDYIKKNYRLDKKRIVEDDPEFRLKSKKYRAHFRIYKAAAMGGMNEREAAKYRAVVIAAQINTVAESDSAYGVMFVCTEADLKDVLASARICIKRFKILDPDEEDEDEAEEGGTSDSDIFVDSTKKPEAWRNARKKKLIKGWKAIDTENYLIVYNAEVKRRLIKNVALHIEAIRKQIYEQMFPPSREVKAISVVRVCKDRAEYHRYGGPGGSAGYWSRGDEELVFYQDKSNKKDSLRVLYHEAFHQYIHYAVGNVAPHSWFNEGHGDYFAGHNYRSKKFIADVFRWRTGIIANAMAQKSYVPLKKFLKYTQGEYYANPGLCYAQGWSFVYFLREVERRKIKKYKQYWGLLDRYFEGIKRNVKSVKEKGLEGLNERPPDADAGDETSEEGTGAKEEEEAPSLPRPPGLEKPFPDEHPLAGAGEAPDAAGPEGGAGRRSGETKTVAGPQFKGIRGGLDAAVDEAFKGIDMAQLEKDWLEFSKRN
ncbi:MAG: gluzincin family metallopeptidase [Planctomycetota bacterium]|jgi:hypothetical protein